MNIEYLGHSAFLISAEKTVVTDPFGDIGYPMKRVKADYCLISHGHFDHCAKENVRGAVVIDSAEKVNLAKDISLECVKTFHDDMHGARRGMNNVYKFVMGGVTFCHFGDLGESFNDTTAKAIGRCDVLFLPVGGNYTIDDKNAYLYAEATGAKLIVPMHFKTPRSKIDIAPLGPFKSRYMAVIEAKDVFETDKEAIDSLPEKTLLTFDTDKF